MSSRTIHEDARCKTSLIYRRGEGFHIQRVDRQSNQKHTLRLSKEELDGLMSEWPQLKDFLRNAAAGNVEPEMNSRPGSKESPARDSSPSSPAERTLL